MSKLRHTLTASLLSGATVALLAASGALFAVSESNEAQDQKIYICHFPPGNRENVQPVAIARSHFDTHADCHDDYLVESDVSGCYMDGEPDDKKGGRSSRSEIFLVEACINRRGVWKGREIIASLSGRISSSGKFCEL
jgi:hypothetical protein